MNENEEFLNVNDKKGFNQISFTSLFIIYHTEALPVANVIYGKLA